jgi:hypothetical protein
MKIKSPVKIDPPAFLNIETLALSEEQASKAATDTSDGAEQSRLFGIYTGQIQARIDRVSSLRFGPPHKVSCTLPIPVRVTNGTRLIARLQFPSAS